MSDSDFKAQIHSLEEKLLDIEKREQALQAERQEVEKQLHDLRIKIGYTEEESNPQENIHIDDPCVSNYPVCDVQSNSSAMIPPVESKYFEYAEYKPKVDVVFARGNPGKNDEGTLFYRKLNDAVRPYYQAFPEKTKDKGDTDVHKSRVSQLVFDVIKQDINGHFLEKRGDLYVQFKEDSVKPKIKQALSEKKQKKDREEKKIYGSELSNNPMEAQLKKYVEDMKKDPNFTTKFKTDFNALNAMWNELMDNIKHLINERKQEIEISLQHQGKAEKSLYIMSSVPNRFNPLDILCEAGMKMVENEEIKENEHMLQSRSNVNPKPISIECKDHSAQQSVVMDSKKKTHDVFRDVHTLTETKVKDPFYEFVAVKRERSLSDASVNSRASKAPFNPNSRESLNLQM